MLSSFPEPVENLLTEHSLPCILYIYVTVLGSLQGLGKSKQN